MLVSYKNVKEHALNKVRVKEREKGGEWSAKEKEIYIFYYNLTLNKNILLNRKEYNADKCTQ